MADLTNKLIQINNVINETDNEPVYQNTSTDIMLKCDEIIDVIKGIVPETPYTYENPSTDIMLKCNEIIESIKKNPGGGSKSLNIYPGIINLFSGNITESETNYYTDEFDSPSEKFLIDYGDVYEAGCIIYDQNGNYIDYWKTNSRYRVVRDVSSYYNPGYKMRLTFPKEALESVLFLDFDNFNFYSGRSFKIYNIR